MANVGQDFAIFSRQNVAGRIPANPATIAVSVACPLPVNAKEPNNSTATRAMGSDNRKASSANRLAAIIGPIVWDEDGPTPILKRLNVL